MTVMLTISLPDELAEEARRAVRDGRVGSVSGYVAAAIEHYRQAQTLDDWLDQMDAELGPPSDEATAWAESVIGTGPARRASA
jgi:Arc/MetJ-type ribon-helix-helix transcriptional regulator